MAEKKTAIKQEDAPVVGADKKVKFQIPPIPGEKHQLDVVVGVNGKNYQIQRGKTVNAPKEVVDIYNRSIKSSMDADSFYFAKAKEFEEKSKG